MVDRVMSPAQDVYEIISKICKYAALRGKETLQIDWDYAHWKGENSPGSPGWA